MRESRSRYCPAKGSRSLAYFYTNLCCPVGRFSKLRLANPNVCADVTNQSLTCCQSFWMEATVLPPDYITSHLSAVEAE